MRKLTIVTTIVLGVALMTSDARAQSVEAGFKGGLNAGTLPGAPEAVGVVNLTSGVRSSGIGGGFVAIRLRDRLWLQPEVLLSAKGATFRGVGAASDRAYVARLRYVEIPALMRLETRSRRMFAIVGPTLAFNVGANYRTENRGSISVRDIDDFVRSHDVALAFGAGTRLGKVLLEGRWTQGLRDIGEAGEFDKAVKTRTLSILAGIAF